MLLGTVILLAFITPKSSFPSFPLSPFLPSYLPTIICKHTLPPNTHTHTICHITRAARPWISGGASDLWCIYFGWEGEFGSISVCSNLSFFYVLTGCWDWHDFLIYTQAVEQNFPYSVDIAGSFKKECCFNLSFFFHLHWCSESEVS